MYIQNNTIISKLNCIIVVVKLLTLSRIYHTFISYANSLHFHAYKKLHTDQTFPNYIYGQIISFVKQFFSTNVHIERLRNIRKLGSALGYGNVSRIKT